MPASSSLDAAGEHHLHDRAPFGAERHAESDFLPLLRDGAGHHTVDADDREK